MDFPWISHGFPLDFGWISCNFSMEFPVDGLSGLGENKTIIEVKGTIIGVK